MNRLRLLWLLLAALLLGGCAQFGAKRPPPPTLDEIVAQSKAGVAPSVIIQRMRESYAVYPLSAAEFARLHNQGVSDEVLNYMQAAYLEEVRRDEAWRSRYRYDPWLVHGGVFRHIGGELATDQAVYACTNN